MTRRFRQVLNCQPLVMIATYKHAQRWLRIMPCALILLSGPVHSQALVEPTTHWAYASFFGTGWYKVSDERSAFILRVAPRWNFGEANIDEQGNRSIGYTLRVPMTLGLNRLDFDDIPGVLDPDNLTTASLNMSLDADIPVTRRFSLRPSGEIGYGTVLGESGSAWTYKAEVRSQYRIQSGKLDWALLASAGLVGYEPNSGPSDDFTYVAAGAEFSYPVSWPPAKDDQMMLHWHLSYTDFIDEIEFKSGVEDVDSVANYWQAGFALGKSREPIRLWFMKFDRLGLAYNFSRNGELRGVKFVFRSLYDL